MNRLLNFCLKTVHILVKVIAFIILDRYILSYLGSWIINPINKVGDIFQSDSRVIYVFILYIACSLTLFYLLGKYVFSFKASETDNFFFSLLIFLTGVYTIAGGSIYGKFSEFFNAGWRDVLYNLVFRYNLSVDSAQEFIAGGHSLGSFFNIFSYIDSFLVAAAVFIGTASTIADRYKKQREMENEIIWRNHNSRR